MELAELAPEGRLQSNSCMNIVGGTIEVAESVDSGTGLYSGIFWGFCLGLGLVYLFRWLQRRKAAMAYSRAVENLVLGRMQKEGLAKLLPKAFFPTWVQFQDFERVRWLNMQMKDLWPHINKATQEYIGEFIEPMMAEYAADISAISSLNFRKLTLGNVPPEIEGVQVEGSSEEEIVLRTQMKWSGNPSIILGIRTVVGAGLTIQVKNVRFWATCRIIFKPLIDQLPCFGAIVLTLPDKPTLNYVLKLGAAGDIDNFPGLRSAIDTIICDAVNDLLVWPARIVIPVGPGDYRDLEMREVAKVEVTLVEARITDAGALLVGSKVMAESKISAKARLYIRNVQGRTQESFQCSNSTHPLWGQGFLLSVEDKNTQKLTVEIWDVDELGQRKVGQATYSVSEAPDLELQDVWLDVVEDPAPTEHDGTVAEPKKVGQVHLEITYRPLGDDGEPLEAHADGAAELVKPSAHRTLAEAAAAHEALSTPSAVSGQQYIRGVIRVQVMRGRNLVSRDANGLSDPFVRVSLLKTKDNKRQSKVVFKTLNPEWNETFELLVEDAKNDMLVVHVFDHDLLGFKDEMGWCAVTFTQVIRQKVVEKDFRLENGGEGVLEMRLEWRQVL